jgi:hypothetical protein
MRKIVLATTFVALGVSIASAAELPRRSFVTAKQTASAMGVWPVALVAHQQAGTALQLPATREASVIPIIPLPKALRPTRPPAGSPL